MKNITQAGLAVVFALFLAASAAHAPVCETNDDASGDLARSVTVSASPGVLKVRGRNESSYRDLGSGTQTLVSGSFLKTGSGGADIILDDNSVLCLDAGTEVQVGMYQNGTLIVQRSGRAGHLVELREGAKYAVRTPYYTARAVGTDFRTTLNYPVEGAVTVEWGEVDILYQERDEATGEPRDVYGFVPQGHTIIWPPDPPRSERLGPGEHEVIHAEQPPPAGVTGRKTAPPAADRWTRQVGNLGRFIRDLRRRFYIGQLSPSDYGLKLREALGIGSGPWPGPSRGPGSQLGGLWIGNAGDVFIIRFCLNSGMISDIRIVDQWLGQDKETREDFNHWVNFTFPGTHFTVERDGRVDGFTTISDTRDIWAGATILMRGYISGRTGRLFIQVTSETDVAYYFGTCTTVDVRLVDPNGCNY